MFWTRRTLLHPLQESWQSINCSVRSQSYIFPGQRYPKTTPGRKMTVSGPKGLQFSNDLSCTSASQCLHIKGVNPSHIPHPPWLVSVTHRTTGTEPLAIGDLWKWGVQAVDMVGRRTGVTAQQLPTILADPTEFHMVVIFLFRVSPNLFQDLFTL